MELRIQVQEELANQIEEIATRQGKSVTGLVQDYLVSLTRQETERRKAIDYLRNLRYQMKEPVPSGSELKQIVAEEMAKKHE